MASKKKAVKKAKGKKAVKKAAAGAPKAERIKALADNAMFSKWCTITDVSKGLKCSRRAVYRPIRAAVKAKLLKRAKVGAIYMFAAPGCTAAVPTPAAGTKAPKKAKAKGKAATKAATPKAAKAKKKASASEGKSGKAKKKSSAQPASAQPANSQPGSSGSPTPVGTTTAEEALKSDAQKTVADANLLT